MHLSRLRFSLASVFMIAVLLTALVPTQAQGDLPAVATGLNNPRGLAYADGALYITEGGTGGDVPIDTPEGPATFGSTSQVSVLAPDGTLNPAITNLPSAGGSGANAIAVTDNAIWLVISAGPPNAVLTFSVLEMDPNTLRVRRSIDMFTPEAINNPDGNEIDSNPTDIAIADDGTVYIVDAGCNCLYSWTDMGGLELFAVWPENPVPTSVTLDANGDLWVGFLSAAPFIPGSAMVQHYTAAGELVEQYDGFNMVVDVLADNRGEQILVVEWSAGLGEAGFQPNTGKLSAITPVGVQNVAGADQLNFPYGIAQNESGAIYVSVNSAFSEPGSGAVLRLGE